MRGMTEPADDIAAAPSGLDALRSGGEPSARILVGEPKVEALRGGATPSPRAVFLRWRQWHSNLGRELVRVNFAISSMGRGGSGRREQIARRFTTAAYLT